MPIFSGEYPTKTTLEDDDKVLISDSSNSNAIKGSKLSSFVSKIINNTRAVAGWIKGSMLEDSTVTYDKLAHDSFSRMTARLGAVQSVNNGVMTRIALSEEVSVGDGLTLTNGTIVVGPNISHVAVSGAAYYFEGMTGATRTPHAYTRVNEVEINRGTLRMNENYNVIVVAEVVVEVSEGDVIDLAVSMGGANFTIGSSRSLLTVIAL
jgi:hypothetical protein